jgi:uncharacterized membrane protein
MTYILLILFYFGLPFFIIKWTLKSEFADKIGAIVIAYIIGLTVGNTGIIPKEYNDFINLLMNFSVAIAVPLMLFSSNLKLWSKFIHRTLLSLLLGLISVVIVIYIGYFIFKKHIPEIWKISGLLVGLYSGGDPNLASLKTALNVNQDTFIIVHTSDMLFGAFFLAFILIAGKKTFELFLPKFSIPKTNNPDIYTKNIEEFHDFKNFFKRQNIPHLIIGFLIALTIVAISFYFGKFSVKYSSVITILSITSISLVLSFFKKIRNLKKNFQLGLYFIIAFSLIVSSSARFSQMMHISSLYILLYVIFAVIASILIHSLLSKIFKIDADTMIITSIALVYSVPFIPVVASSLKNKYIIITGMIIGLMGYAIGNYLGIIVAYSLR